MKMKKIIAAAASLAFILQMMPMQVMAEEVSDLSLENEQADNASAVSEGTDALSDEELLQQVNELAESYALPDVGVGFIELDPEQTEALVRSVDKQKVQNGNNVSEGYKASLYTFHSDYFRDQLNTAEKELFDSWVKVCSDFMVSTDDLDGYFPDYVVYDPSEISEDRAVQIVTYAYYSYPEFFFLNNGNVTGSSGSVCYIAPYVNENFTNGSFRNETYNEITSKTALWMNEVNKLSSDLEKERYIAESICNTVTYTFNYPLDQSLYGSLVQEKAVCNGYAMEMNYFCNAAGIDCITVISPNHAWNNVKLYGDWFIVDTTWMDQETYIWEDWYNINTAAMNTQDTSGVHTVKSSLYTNITLPSCTKTEPTVPEEEELAINAANFPDSTFRTYISDKIDLNGNGSLSKSEIDAVVSINVSGTAAKPNTVTDLKGVEHFTNLLELWCSYNQLTSLDVSKNTSLESLFCTSNKLTTLDLSKNTKLDTLQCNDNQLTTLNISGIKGLYYFYCYNNRLTSIDVSDSRCLTVFKAYGNSYPIGDVVGSYSLSKLPKGFDPSKASEWSGAEYDSSSNSLKNFTSDTVTYTYDCGLNNTAKFTLKANSVITKPALPTGLKLSAGDGSITASWNAVSGATSYTVYTYLNGKYTKAATPVSTKYTITGLKNGTKYGVLVLATNAAGNSEFTSSDVRFATPVSAKPALPTGLKLSAGDGSITASWNAVSGATSYTVYTYLNSKYIKIGTTTSTKYTITNLKNGTKYGVLVLANNASGSSAFTANDVKFATPVAAKPALPTGLTLTPGNGSITASWKAVSGASYYTVYTYLNSKYIKIGTTTSAKYTITNLKNGTKYGVLVLANNASGSSSFTKNDVKFATPVASAKPALPTGLKLAAGNGSITASWNAVSGASYYTVYTYFNGKYTKVGTPVSTRYTISGLKNGTKYGVLVLATNSAGSSSFTKNDVRCATPTASVKPALPTGLKLASGNGKISASWNAVSGASYYTVYTYYGGKYHKEGITVSAKYDITGLTNGARYGVLVLATNSAGSSDFTKYDVKFITPMA